MKLPVLVAVPPFVVTPIFPVVAPVGTVAVISVSEMTLKEAYRDLLARMNLPLQDTQQDTK